ncbi:MAG: hypothetical protein M1832_005584 [Thelocarpon impressellum]|nr:MAG: hypothetical protein M1832_005584 [Thelocarpon impressellum]
MATSPAKRLPPLPAIDRRPVTRGTGREPSPPRTPVSDRPRQPSAGDVTPGQTATRMAEENATLERYSHDLCISPRGGGRDSLVDNMLLSLDQFNTALPAPASLSSGASRPRGHTHSSSYSSDLDLRGHDVSSRYSSHLSRGRRSNSSSNFQSVLERIDSLRGPDKGRARGPVSLPSSRHTMAHQTSFDSDRSAFDPTVARSSGVGSRWTGSMDLRSSSLDYTQRGRSLYGSQSTDFVPDSYGAYDAAPMPNIPSGPRGQHSPVRQSMLPDQTTHMAPQTPPKEERKNSLMSRSIYPPSARLGSFAGAGAGRELPAIPAFAEPEPDPAAPGPTVSYHKSASGSRAANAPAKERPGFFRRVFGSSKSSHTLSANSVGSPQISPPQTPAPPPRDRSTSRGKLNHIADQMKSSPAPPATPVPSVPPKDSHPTLNKKPSFFSRRRKKSISEAPPPPALPPQRLPSDSAETVQAVLSPTSSLRKVMNPYLKSPGAPPDAFYDNGERFTSAYDREPRPFGSFSTQGADALPTTRRAPQENGSAAHSQPAEGPARDKSPVRPLHDAPRPDEPPTTPTAASAPEPTRQAPQPGASSDHAPTPRGDLYEGELEECVPLPGPKHARDVSLTGASFVSDRAALKASPLEEHFLQEPTARRSVGRTPESPLVSPSTIGDYKSASSLPFAQDEIEPVKAEPEAATEEATEQAPTAEQTPEPEAVAPPAAAAEPPVAAEPEPPASDRVDETEPTADDREKARKIYDGAEDFISKATAAAWLGESGLASARARKAYLQLFDWTNLNILAAMRSLCAKLILKGETQQVDRILDAVSTRWCQCNPHHGFKAPDVVHTICYSILLLNTDLYLADIEQKMTRSQYVKNTMPTIRRVAADAAPDSFEPPRSAMASTSRDQTPLTEPGSPGLPPTLTHENGSSGDLDQSSRRASRRPSACDEATRAPTPLDFDTHGDDCGPLVKAPFNGPSRTWEVQVEIVLKAFFNSIRMQRLPLHGVSAERMPDQSNASSSLSVLTGGMLRRTPSSVSRVPSETQSHRGRPDVSRAGTGRWSSKTRSRPRIYPRSAVGSSRTSFEDEASLWSPTGSSTWSRYSLNKTQTSMSVESFGSGFPQADYQQSIGFANALSQAIIREEAADAATPHERIAPLLEDETLGLVGAPWAKEGILKHKHHLMSVDKKANHRNWNECFAVIEKGWMRLFSFSGKSSLRLRNKARQPSGGVVGGGNWSENAEALGSFLLRQTIASALPPPGYSKTRPHVWALSLPTGAVHLFQVGTPDIVKEFVSTANYWSARLSKEPLVGAISNIEYGWGDAVISGAVAGPTDASRPPTSSGRRPSLQSSIRSSMDQNSMMRARLAGDRVTISDWTPPQQSMMASQLLEVDQLNGLLTYVKNVEAELQKHNELRSPMLVAFSARHPNSAKAMANWERKSSYLLREIVKFRTYIDCLSAAQAQKERIYVERAADEAGAGDGPVALEA